MHRKAIQQYYNNNNNSDLLLEAKFDGKLSFKGRIVHIINKAYTSVYGHKWVT